MLVPFGGGIDSVVTTLLADPRRTLFIVSPSSGRFAPLEDTAAVTGLPIVRATRTLDSQLLGDEPFFHGHVPVTAMVTLLAAVAAVASGRGGVVMSNEHSASAANLRWNDLEVNHQWSKSLAAEILIAEALSERIGDQLTVASFLRDRSEVWVAQAFSRTPSVSPRLSQLQQSLRPSARASPGHLVRRVRQVSVHQLDARAVSLTSSAWRHLPP